MQEVEKMEGYGQESYQAKVGLRGLVQMLKKSYVGLLEFVSVIYVLNVSVLTSAPNRTVQAPTFQWDPASMASLSSRKMAGRFRLGKSRPGLETVSFSAVPEMYRNIIHS